MSDRPVNQQALFGIVRTAIAGARDRAYQERYLGKENAHDDLSLALDALAQIEQDRGGQLPEPPLVDVQAEHEDGRPDEWLAGLMQRAFPGTPGRSSVNRPPAACANLERCPIIEMVEGLGDLIAGVITQGARPMEGDK